MSEFAIYSVESAPADSRESLAAAEKKFGFVPNLLGELAAAPAALNAYVTLNELLSKTSLSAVEQQLVLATTSIANSCHYCVAAHSAGLRAAGLPDDEVQALRAGRSLSDARLEALRRFVVAVVVDRGAVKQAELNRFLGAGYSREQVLEVLVGVSMKTLSNYTNHIADTPLDTAFQAYAWEPAMA